MAKIKVQAKDVQDPILCDPDFAKALTLVLLEDPLAYQCFYRFLAGLTHQETSEFVGITEEKAKQKVVVAKRIFIAELEKIKGEVFHLQGKHVRRSDILAACSKFPAVQAGIKRF